MIILLTGATSGIGFETLKQLVSDGHTVYAIGRNFKNVDNYFKTKSSQIIQIICNLNDIKKIDELFIKFENIKFDSLIHCAGVEETLPLTLCTSDVVQNIFDINVFSAFQILRNFAKKKYSNDEASVIFLSSVMAKLGQPGKISYCATKSALLGIVKASALELSKRKIRVNAILPGIIRTPMTEKLFNSLSSSQVENIEKMHPLGFGEVTDVVPMIQFLISNKARWITGQEFIIDGGYSIQ